MQSLQSNQKPIAYGPLCDLWSIGIVAYELVIGRTPFNFELQETDVYSKKIITFDFNLKYPESAGVSLCKTLI